MADKKTSDETQAQESQLSISNPDIDETTTVDNVSTETVTSADDTSEIEETQDTAKSDDANSSVDLIAEEDVATDLADDEAEMHDTDSDPSELVDAEQPEGEDTDQSSDDPILAPPPAIEVERIVEKRGGFGAALLGGVVAAGLGFVAGQTNILGDFMPPSWRAAESVDAAALEQLQNNLNAQIAELETRVSANAASDLMPLKQQIDALTQGVMELQSVEPASDNADWVEAVDVLAIRVDALESRPIIDAASPAVVAAFEAELSKLQDSLAAQRSEVEKMVADARAMDAASAEAARIASAQTIVARLRSSIDSGTSFSGMIVELQAVGVTVPDALAGSAEAGVTSQSSLRDGFAPAARDALAEARQETKGTGGIAAYVRRQLGARSVAPRDGDDPDAVLSRVEAAVQSGDLQAALVDLQALPETARAPLADWEAAVRARIAASTAVNELAQSLNAK
ncbi:hypothetical protein [Phaeobacter sp. C3_T13_0]|uniref:COG4223 family protein n=1 Tax=Phaeobacter cretensis TaxID=3342641 RepID=UPI0039BC5045